MWNSNWFSADGKFTFSWVSSRQILNSLGRCHRPSVQRSTCSVRCLWNLPGLREYITTIRRINKRENQMQDCSYADLRIIIVTYRRSSLINAFVWATFHFNRLNWLHYGDTRCCVTSTASFALHCRFLWSSCIGLLDSRHKYMQILLYCTFEGNSWRTKLCVSSREKIMI